MLNKLDTAPQLLRNPNVEPTDAVIAEGLGASYDTYLKFTSGLESRGIELQWRYYTDGNAWLGKGLHIRTGPRGGKKESTVFWLSIWDGFFKISIFIPEKARVDALGLPLGDTARQMVSDSKQMGKLKFFAVIFDVASDNVIEDIYTLADFRKKLK